MEVKAVLFDLDGVLVDSLDAWFYVFNDALNYFGLKALKKKDFSRSFGKPIEYDLKNYFVGKTEREVMRQYNKFFKKRKGYVKLFPQSAEVLKNIKKRKLKLGLISNSTKFIVMSVLNHYKLRKYFDVIIAMEDVKNRKPAPDSVLKACRLLKVKPQNAILIGDTMNDMIAGEKAGCVTVGYKIEGDYKIDELKNIEKLLSNK